MIILESIIDGIRDIKDHFGRTLLQLLGIILGAGSIVATFSLSVAGKEASMKYYRISGGIEKIWIGDKPTGKITLDAKALASKGLTYARRRGVARAGEGDRSRLARVAVGDVGALPLVREGARRHGRDAGVFADE